MQRSLSTLVLAILVIATVLFAPLFSDSQVLLLCDAASTTVLARRAVTTGDQLVFHWIHSFELIPWREEYTIEADQSFLLHTTAFPAFGAGIPANKGVVSIEENQVVMRAIDERFDHFAWIHSQTALTAITVAGEEFITGGSVDHHRQVTLSVKGIESLWKRLRWMR